MEVRSTNLRWLTPLLLGGALAGWAVVQGNIAAWTVAAIGAALWGAVLLHLTHLRTREIVVWIVLLICVLNFAPALVSEASRLEDPLWSRFMKDVAVGLLAVTAFSVRSERGMRGFKGVLLVWAGIVALVGLFSEIAIIPALVSARYYLLYPAAAVFAYRLNLRGDEIHRLMVGLIVLGVVEAIVALADYAVLGDTYYATAGIQPRAIGTLGNPNNLALFLGFPAVMALTLLRGWRRWVAGLALSAGVVVSFSRSFVPALIFAYLPKLGRRRTLVFLLSAAVAFVIVLFAGRGVELGSRRAGTEYALGLWQESPRTFLVGQGWGFASPAPLGGGLAREPVIDNQILLLLVEGGMVALAGFTALVVVAVRGAWAHPSPDVLAVAISRSMLFFLPWGLVAVNFRLFPGALLFWMLAGFGTALSQSITGGVPYE